MDLGSNINKVDLESLSPLLRAEKSGNEIIISILRNDEDKLKLEKRGDSIDTNFLFSQENNHEWSQISELKTLQ